LQDLRRTAASIKQDLCQKISAQPILEALKLIAEISDGYKKRAGMMQGV
jgi:hypothetical protein